ncbi:unnamed protein product [Darwinula stevensoni]|uniref:guanylate kinase n=1 Tax=Darwinula stevensoni TaxID=69355 RepID=A0A7R9A762_9CRUS|nr:unnamed protein product [Darwinula stevensoni]CAG0891797.1 unnamed protein product [Darwinula stevensoni]
MLGRLSVAVRRGSAFVCGATGRLSESLLGSWSVGCDSAGFKIGICPGRFAHSTVMKRPRPLVLCGPSGCGKSTLTTLLMKDFGDYIRFSVSHTTRPPRSGELNGVHYYFVNREDMEEDINRGDFIESAEYSGNLYGTSKRAIEEVQEMGKICLLDIDIQGVKQLKSTPLNPLYIFVKPPNLDELEKRLRSRGTETDESIQRRLQVAERELELGMKPGYFDLVIVNDDLEAAYKHLKRAVGELVDQARV